MEMVFIILLILMRIFFSERQELHCKDIISIDSVWRLRNSYLERIETIKEKRISENPVLWFKDMLQEK